MSNNFSPTPLVSIVIPVYKVEKYIRACIESVLVQTFPAFEVILVDDGSPDDSGKICDEFSALDARVRVFHKDNGGVTSARKLGVERSRGEWIMFLDADDILASDALETLLRFADSETDLVEGNIKYFRDGLDRPAFQQNQKSAKLSYETDAAGYAIGVGKGWVQSFKIRFSVAPWGKIIRRTLLTENVMDVPAEFVYGEDTILLLRLSARGLRRAKKIDACVLAVRKREGSASFSPCRREENYLLKLYKEMHTAVQPFPDKIRQQALAAIAFHARALSLGIINNGRISAYPEWLAIFRPAANKFSLDPRSMFFFYLVFKFRLANLLRPLFLVYFKLHHRNS